MLNLNTKTESHLNTNSNSNSNNNINTNNNNNNSILAFKPRQVILSAHYHCHNPKPTPTMNLASNESKITNLTPEIKVKLDALILNYLNRNGFNKTLKRFRSEARIESDAWKASSLHLEDIFCKYNACNADGNKNTSKKPVFGQDKSIDYDNVYPTNEEPTTKKKKGITESENGGIVDQSEVRDTKMVESDTMRVDEPELKPKKKKKTKHDLYSSSQDEVKIDTINELKIDNSTKKTKEKKKTSMQEDQLMPSTSNDNELATDGREKERKKKKKKSTTDGLKDEEADVVKMDAGSENMSSKEKKSSKKRKRDENENLSTEVTISEESKCQKTQTFKEEKSKKEEINPQETSNKQLDGKTNGGEKSDAKKSTKKGRNVTDEPKMVIAFQRVKIDQVEFADEKLQDNSYWAKDGADIGYGAKAQEVLGQVRGRDFRHEKTKKQRGSYRGGSIDLQSHSIKFNYSDEE